MKLVRLGNSGLKVSELVLGCMSFGESARGTHEWTLGETESLPFFEAALEAGITTFDTADMYSLGSSEEITGKALRTLANRDDVVIATKAFMKMRDSHYSGGLSLKHLVEAAEASLRRLGTDFIDLYQIHRFDPDTPVEETMRALDDLVRSGKVRYVGASSMAAWQFAKMQHAAQLGGWTPFVAMQDQYNLLQREEEREMHGLTLDQGVGVLPWSPLARGRLSRPWGEESRRSETDLVTQGMYNQGDESNAAIVGAVARVAERHGVSMSQVALAWVRQKPAVTAPIIGATKLSHLQDAVRSLEIRLDEQDVAELESSYTPRWPEGY